jgi:hypothetical protein
VLERQSLITAERGPLVPINVTASQRALATQQVSPGASNNLRNLQLTGSKLLRDDVGRPLWKYEVSGTLNGKPVTIAVDERGVGNVKLTLNGKTRTPNQHELRTLETVLAAYSKANNYNPPQGVSEARIAIAEKLNGEAPLAKWTPGKVREGGNGWLGMSGSFGPNSKRNVEVGLNTNTGEVTVLYQVNASSARQRTATADELKGLISALSKRAQTSQQMGDPYALFLTAAKRQLAAGQRAG